MASRLIDKYDIFYHLKIKVFHKFENIFITLKRIFFRSINYAVLIFSQRGKKKQNLIKSHEVVVPKRDITNVSIVSFFLLSLLTLLIDTRFSLLIFFSLILFLFNNFKLLVYIKKNLNFISMIKSYFIQLAIILANTTGVIIAIFIVYLIRQKGYKY